MMVNKEKYQSYIMDFSQINVVFIPYIFFLIYHNSTLGYNYQFIVKQSFIFNYGKNSYPNK